jgi:hypothetical protein
MGSFGQTSLKCKISCKCAFKRGLPPAKYKQRRELMRSKSSNLGPDTLGTICIILGLNKGKADTFAQ